MCHTNVRVVVIRRYTLDFETFLTNPKNTIRQCRFAVTSSGRIRRVSAGLRRMYIGAPHSMFSDLKQLCCARAYVCRPEETNGKRRWIRKQNALKIVFTLDAGAAVDKKGIISICLAQTDFIPRNSARQRTFDVLVDSPLTLETVIYILFSFLFFFFLNEYTYI